MAKWFNTAGPCQADIHYMLSPLARLPQLSKLIEQRGYFVAHAPRQVGKTTAMLALAQQLTDSGRYAAVMVSAEVGAPFPHDPGKAEAAIDDIQFLIDLGLCRMSAEGGLAIANPIYREVLPRVLSQTPQASLPQISPSWLTPCGSLDPDKRLQACLSFWRQHGQPLLRSAPYHEIAPHLVLMAFLHRVVNGGGTLEREYAIGSDRMDLCLRYGPITLGMELKVWRQGRPDPLAAGLPQLDRYLAGLGLQTGWLMIFDRGQDYPPSLSALPLKRLKPLGGGQSS